MKSILLKMSILGLLLSPSATQASILSKLAKLGNKLDNIEVGSLRFSDANLSYLNIADLNNHQLVVVKPRMTGGWQLTNAQGLVVHSLAGAKDPILILDKAAIPADLSVLSTLPRNAKLLIRDRGNFFELDYVKSPIVKIGKIRVAIQSASHLKEVLWQLQRPIVKERMQLLSANFNKPSTIDGLLNGSGRAQASNVLIVGKVTQGIISIADKRVELGALKKAAQNQNANLIIVDADKSALVKVDEVLRLDQKQQSASRPFLTYEFLNKINDSNSSFALDVSDSGNFHTLLQSKSVTAQARKADSSSDTSIVVATHLGIHSVLLLRPNQARQTELDEMLWGVIPTWLLGWLVFSFLVGLWARQELNALLSMIWKKPSGRLNSGFRTGFFYLLWLPLLGIYAGIYKIIKFILKIIWYSLVLIYLALSWPFKKIFGRA